MKRKSLLFGLIIFIAGFYSGCIPSKPSESVELLPTDRLIKKLEANRRKVKNFEGVGTINLSTPEMNNSASFKVIILRPDSVYFNIYGPFGIDLAEAIITSNDFIFYDDIHNTVYKGKNDSNILEKIFKIDITFGEIMDMFIGGVNLTPKLSKEPDDYKVEYDKYVLTYNESEADRKSKYFIDIRELIITDYQLVNKADKIMAEGEYSKFKTRNGLSIPYSIKIQRKKEKEFVNIEYRNVEINKNNIKIHLDIPEDAEVVQL